MKCPVCQNELDASSSFCPFCGSRLGQAGASIGSASHSGLGGMAIGLILLLVLGGLFATGELVPLATRAYDGTRTILTSVICLYPPLRPGSRYTATPWKATSDQQVLSLFAQTFSSLSYNVTALTP